MKLRAIVGIATGGLLALGGFLMYRWAYKGPLDHFGREIPPWGLQDNPRALSNPGHPEVVEAAFHKIYRAMVAYRQIHGVLPSADQLLDFSNPLAPGYQLNQSDFKFADDYLSDAYDPNSQHRSELQFNYKSTRPDGSPIPSNPPPGQRVAWLVCDDYAHSNQVITREPPYHETPTGFYIVLYSDGTVARVPYGKVVFSKDPSDGSFNHEMPGISGEVEDHETQEQFDKAQFGNAEDYSKSGQAVLDQ